MWSNESNSTCFLPSESLSYKIVAAVRAASALFSLVFSISALVLNVASKKYLVPLHRMVLYFSVSGIVTGISKALSRVDYFEKNESTAAFCIFAAFLDEYTGWTSVLSALSIAYNLCMDVLGRANDSKCAQRFWLLLIFVGPLAFSWIPFINLAYGQSADWAWCSLRRVREDCSIFTIATVFHYSIWFVPAATLITVIFILYAITVVVVVRRRVRWYPVNNNIDSFKNKRKTEREVAILALPLLVFFVTNGLSLFVTVTEQLKVHVFPLWIAYASLPQISAALIAFLMTVDKDSCRALARCNLIRHRRAVKEYEIKEVIESSGTIKRTSP